MRVSVRSDRRVTVGVAGVYAMVSYVTMFPTWPSRLSTRIPDVVGDNLLNLWIFRWDGHHLFSGWADLWNAPIFWPNRNALAYSDSLLPIAVVHRVLVSMLRSDVLAFNLVFLAAAFASMLGGYLLARRITGSVGGAFVAGLVYAVATPRLVQYQHAQLGFGCFIPFVILLTVRYFDAPSIGRGLALGLVTALLVLSTSYYGLMTLTALLVIVPGVLVTWRRFPMRRVGFGLVVGVICAAALVAPVALKYNSVERHAALRRLPDPALAAHLGDFVRVPPDNRLIGNIAVLSEPTPGGVENFLFPGLVACGLGVIGLLTLLRHARELFAKRALEILTLTFCCAASMVLLVFSFGAVVKVGNRLIGLPYSVVEGLPGFAGVRATARFVAFPLLTLALLAALGLGRLTRTMPRRKRLAIVAACAAFFLVETSIPIKISTVPAAAEQTAVNHELASIATGPVAELPMVSRADGGNIWAGVEVPRMWLATIDGDPRVGGYSGEQPPGFTPFVRAVNRFPNNGAVDRLTSMGVRYVVLRVWNERRGAQPDSNGFYSDRQAKRIVSQLPHQTRNLGRYGDAYLITLYRTAGTPAP